MSQEIIILLPEVQTFLKISVDCRVPFADEFLGRFFSLLLTQPNEKTLNQNLGTN